jgi:hypothetical protein
MSLPGPHWVRLQDGPARFGEIWPFWSEQDRSEALLRTLQTYTVPMRAYVDRGTLPERIELRLWRFSSIGPLTPRYFVKFAVKAGVIGVARQEFPRPFEFETLPDGRKIPRATAVKPVLICRGVEFDLAAATDYAVANLLPAGAPRKQVRQPNRSRPRISGHALRSWYERYVESKKAAGVRTSAEDDWEAAKAEFGLRCAKAKFASFARPWSQRTGAYQGGGREKKRVKIWRLEIR